MKYMIVPTGEYYNDIRMFKCKRCKIEFGIIWNSEYVKTICFCPSCGQAAQKISRKNEMENEE